MPSLQAPRILKVHKSWQGTPCSEEGPQPFFTPSITRHLSLHCPGEGMGVIPPHTHIPRGHKAGWCDWSGSRGRFGVWTQCPLLSSCWWILGLISEHFPCQGSQDRLNLRTGWSGWTKPQDRGTEAQRGLRGGVGGHTASGALHSPPSLPMECPRADKDDKDESP